MRSARGALHPTELAIGEHVVRADEQRHPNSPTLRLVKQSATSAAVMSTATSTLTSISHRSSGHLPGSLEVPSIGEGGVARCGGRRGRGACLLSLRVRPTVDTAVPISVPDPVCGVTSEQQRGRVTTGEAGSPRRHGVPSSAPLLRRWPTSGSSFACSALEPARHWPSVRVSASPGAAPDVQSCDAGGR